MADTLLVQNGKTLQVQINPLSNVPAIVTLELDVSTSQNVNLTSISQDVTGATAVNTPSTVVKRDASGDFAAGTITASLNGAASTAAAFTGTLTGDVTGTQSSTVVGAVGGSTSTAVHSAELLANAATNLDTVSTIVKRDSSGNFSAGTITAALTGNATTSTTAGNVSGTVAIANGGTGQTTANPALNALLPAQGSSSGKFLKTDGANTSWATSSSLASPLTTKGDVWGYTSTDARVPVGSDGTVLTADSTQTSGVKWTATGSGLPGGALDGQFVKNQGGTAFWSSYRDLPQAINYILNANAETDTTGWAKYADAAGNIPVDGTGGTATNLTFSRNTSSPIRGLADFKLVQANSTSIQGDGLSYDFTIDQADEAKPLSINFDYNASSTFVASDGSTPLNDGTTSTNSGNSDVEVFVYDKTNSQLIPVSPQVLTAKGANSFNFKGTFQTASNSTSYRLIFHVATTSANATGWTVHLANIYVGPQTFAQGVPVTDWTSYTPTLGGFGTATNISGRWRRVGDSMEFITSFTTGTPSASILATVSLPSGYSVDSSKLSINNTSSNPGNVVGEYEASTPAANNGGAVLTAPSTDAAQLYFSPVISVASSGLTPSIGQNVVDVTKTFAFFAKVPILGWSSNVQMSNDTDTRVVTAQVYQNASLALSAGTAINFNTINYDSHGAYSAGTYTTPVSGYYEVATAGFYDSTAPNITLYKNGSYYAGFFTAQANAVGSTIGVNCKAGDTLTIVPIAASGTLLYSSGNFQATVTYKRLSGPSSIAATETVSADYYLSANTAFNSTQINFDTSSFDDHGAVTTGASWKFTAPISGKYSITVGVGYTSGTGSDITLYKNGSAYRIISYTGTVTSGDTGATLINLVPGDFIDVRTDVSITLHGGTGTDNRTYISIVRVGN